MLQPFRFSFPRCLSLFLILCFFFVTPGEAHSAHRHKATNHDTQQDASVSAKSRKGKKRTNRGTKAPINRFKGAILYNVTANKIVFAQGDSVPVPPASLTKILSMYVALDTMRARKISPNSIVTVSRKAAAAHGSRMGLHTGDRVALDDLLRGMAVASGNDSSIAVAEYIGGSEAGFVKKMNQKAKQIGMRGSVFRTANGLPAPGQVTTARDMLTLARSYLRAYPENLGKFHNLRTNTYEGSTVSNANPMLGSFYGADGLKTGYVDASGYNIIATARRDQVRIIGVILGAPTSSVRAREAAALLEAGFGRLACPLPPVKGKRFAEFGDPNAPLDVAAEDPKTAAIAMAPLAQQRRRSASRLSSSAPAPMPVSSPSVQGEASPQSVSPSPPPQQVEALP